MEEPAKVLVVCSRFLGNERSHVTANVATTLVQMGVRTLLIDLDPAGEATLQLFEESSIRSLEGDTLTAWRAVPPSFLTLNLQLFHWGFFVRTAKLHTLPARRDLRRIEEKEPAEIAGLVDGLLESVLFERRRFAPFQAAGKKFDLILIDAPKPPSRLASVSMARADFVLVPVRAGGGFDSEMRSTIQSVRDAGLSPGKLLFVLTCTAASPHLREELQVAIDRIREELKKGRAGALLKAEVRHDIGVLGTHGIERQTRDDWVALSAELLARIEPD